MYLFYIFDRWVSLVVINIGFHEIRMKRLETSSFVKVASIYWYIDRWVTIVVVNIGFQEVSMKWHETSFFLVVAWVDCIYLIDVVIHIGFQEIRFKRLETTFFCGSCMYLLYIFDRCVYSSDKHWFSRN